LNEEYFEKDKNRSVSNIEENKEDAATVFHSIKENYMNYRSNSLPDKEFINEEREI